MAIIVPSTDFDPRLTLECGQCFRFTESGGVYTVVAGCRAVSLWRNGGETHLDCSREDYDAVWAHYFDMERDYATARARVSIDPFTAAAAEYGRGIRILRQDFYETLISFIISPCNNIARIKSIIARLCELYGEEFTYKGAVYHAFPKPETLARLTAADLAPIRAGYRAPHIIAASQYVLTNPELVDIIKPMLTAAAVKRLIAIPGVGPKVANCVLLFGVGKRDAFPIDTWMKKALAAHYPPAFDGSAFGEDAGLAQQYIFHYIRSKS